MLVDGGADTNTADKHGCRLAHGTHSARSVITACMHHHTAHRIYTPPHSALYKAAQLGAWRIAHTVAKNPKTKFESGRLSNTISQLAVTTGVLFIIYPPPCSCITVHPDDRITPVMTAVENGHLNTTRMLAKLGADVNHSYDDGMSPLMFALSTVTSFPVCSSLL